MYTRPFWIQGNWPGRLAVSPRPPGGDWLEDEINHRREQRVDVVVSLLVPDEVHEFNLEQEQKYCEQTGISFHWFGKSHWTWVRARASSCIAGRGLGVPD